MKKLLVLLFFFSSFSLFSQKVKQIELVRSNTLEVREKYGHDIKFMIGDVVFQHDSAFMYCDSAKLNTKLNNLFAYGKIHFSRGDTLHLYGDSVKYDGNTKLAQIRGNVLLTRDSLRLNTDSLDFDLNQDLAYYRGGGRTVNGVDTLESEIGRYYSRDELFFFKGDVVVKNPEYTITSDTLKHNTKSRLSSFYGPTEILGDSNYIYCENGWYNHEKNIAQFNKNAFLKNNKQQLSGDSLYYDRNLGVGRAFKNIVLKDTVENVIFRGNYARYFESPEFAEISGRAEFSQISEQDTLFLHADTLKSEYNAGGDARFIKAFYHTKMFRKDFQAKCDSLVYSFQDSVIQMFSKPVLWAEKSQLSAKQIEMFIQNGEISRIEMQETAFIVSKEDSLHFNQVKGKNMVAHLRENKLYQIDVNSNGETLYYMRDEAELIGLNETKCDHMKIYMQDGEVFRIAFFVKPIGTIYPMQQVKPASMNLKGLNWQEKHRPKTRADIFRWEK